MNRILCSDWLPEQAFLPALAFRVFYASKSSLFLLEILYDCPSLFGQDSWILTFHGPRRKTTPVSS